MDSDFTRNSAAFLYRFGEMTLHGFSALNMLSATLLLRVYKATILTDKTCVHSNSFAVRFHQTLQKSFHATVEMERQQ